MEIYKTFGNLIGETLLESKEKNLLGLVSKTYYEPDFLMTKVVIESKFGSCFSISDELRMNARDSKALAQTVVYNVIDDLCSKMAENLKEVGKGKYVVLTQEEYVKMKEYENMYKYRGQ